MIKTVVGTVSKIKDLAEQIIDEIKFLKEDCESLKAAADKLKEEF